MVFFDRDTTRLDQDLCLLTRETPGRVDSTH